MIGFMGFKMVQITISDNSAEIGSDSVTFQGLIMFLKHALADDYLYFVFDTIENMYRVFEELNGSGVPFGMFKRDRVHCIDTRLPNVKLCFDAKELCAYYCDKHGDYSIKLSKYKEKFLNE